MTLTEDILLLTFNDRTGRATRLPVYSIEFAVAGAVLADLALRDRIDTDLHELMVVDPSPTGDDVLDTVLAEIVDSSQRTSTKQWLLHLARVESLRTRSLDGLVEQGILRQRRRRLPLALGSPQYEVADRAKPRDIRARVRSVAMTEAIPDPRDAVLLCLCSTCDLMTTVLNRHELKTCSTRIEQVTRMDLIAQGMVRELRETREVVHRVGYWGVGKTELEGSAES